MARFTRPDNRDENEIREAVFALIENETGELDDFDAFKSWCESMAEIAFDRHLDGSPMETGVRTICERNDPDGMID